MFTVGRQTSGRVGMFPDADLAGVGGQTIIFARIHGNGGKRQPLPQLLHSAGV